MVSENRLGMGNTGGIVGRLPSGVKNLLGVGNTGHGGMVGSVPSGVANEVTGRATARAGTLSFEEGSKFGKETGLPLPIEVAKAWLGIRLCGND